LNQFYKTQLSESSDSFGPGGGYGGLADLNYSSPSSISRLLNLYSSAGKGKANKRQKPQPMREAIFPSEGLRVFNPSTDSAAVQRLRNEGWDATASTEQKNIQTEGRERVRFKEDLRPVATLLRTKRSKRCRTCRTLLSRPEPKVSSTRYKIKVLALNNIPRVTIRPLPSSQPSTVPPTSIAAASAPGLGKGEDGSADPVLQPLLPQQFLLTLTNPLFDPIRVTLATPSSTPGPVSSRVTILCPQFDVGANTDVWDDALNTRETRGRSALGGQGIGTASSGSGTADTSERQAEAGKVWERGRNWTSVIVEVVPGLLPGSTGAGVGLTERWEELGEDEDVLEIPVFVRIEYDTEAQGGAEEKVEGKGGKERREVTFWCVLGIGRIAG
jgi:dynactin-4